MCVHMWIVYANISIIASFLSVMNMISAKTLLVTCSCKPTSFVSYYDEHQFQKRQMCPAYSMIVCFFDNLFTLIFILYHIVFGMWLKHQDKKVY
jgi:hypothetical protein